MKLIPGEINLFQGIPFLIFFLCVLLLPQFAPEFWKRKSSKVSVASLSVLFVFYFFGIRADGFQKIYRIFLECFSLLCFMGSLYIVSGGIVLRGRLKNTPLSNTLFLAVGGLLANVIGSLGASMLLIRPFLRSNKNRSHHLHLPLFFIIIISNIGGMITPIGMPPLYLGYLKGAHFPWTFNLLAPWGFCFFFVVLIFYLVEKRFYRKENLVARKDKESSHERFEVKGSYNFLFLFGLFTSVFFETPYRESVMLALSSCSLIVTSHELREENKFSFGPLVETAIYFIAFFITLAPLLSFMENRISIETHNPKLFFWTSGLLSAFLDNTASYLSIFSLAKTAPSTGNLVAGIPESILSAISCGVIMMGTLTYLGNTTNLLIRNIAKKNHFNTPSFLAYSKFASLILIPLFFLISFIFFY